MRMRMMMMMMMMMMILQEPSASTLFAKSAEKLKDLLPQQYDESGGVLADDDFFLGDSDDWNLPPGLSDDQQEEAELLRQRGLCMNELDITASATDIDW